MKWIHPNVSRAALAALALTTGLVGCRTQQGGLVNPFLAPNRVPPPATRAILPGQAQPYYPGDPLPVMQSGVAPATNAVAASSGSSQPMPTADSHLPWTSPGSSSPSIASLLEPRAFVLANEPTVAIPTDAGSLRFDLPPTAAPVPLTPTANIAPPQPMQLAAMPSNQTIVPASYTEPVASNPFTTGGVQPVIAMTQAPSSPWRSPQVDRTTAAPTPVAPPLLVQTQIAQPAVLPPPPHWPPSQMQFAAVPNSMDVRLRAVPSPPLGPGDPTPRIRLPSYTASAQTFGADGFRPRSSMR